MGKQIYTVELSICSWFCEYKCNIYYHALRISKEKNERYYKCCIVWFKKYNE